MSAEHEPQVPVEEAESPEQVDGVHATADAPEDDAAVEVEHDLDELLARAGKADEYLALAQRTQADFENFRKRMTRDVAAAEQRGVGKLAKELLPALDNLGRALAHAEEPDGAENGGEHLAAGVKLVHDELLAALQRVGIEPFSPRGERFDPNEHEAMAQQAVEGADAGTVVEVYQQGFRHGESVLRPARVVVAA
jgi:molecular chaperone GrpE